MKKYGGYVIRWHKVIIALSNPTSGTNAINGLADTPAKRKIDMITRFFNFFIAAVFLLACPVLGGFQFVEEIPPLSEWGFIIMGIGLLSLGVRFLRRRALSD